MKSGATIAGDFAQGVDGLAGVLEAAAPGCVVYGGRMRQTRGTTTFVPWTEVDGLAARGESTADQPSR
jgi:hypothetical protein